MHSALKGGAINELVDINLHFYLTVLGIQVAEAKHKADVAIKALETSQDEVASLYSQDRGD